MELRPEHYICKDSMTEEEFNSVYPPRYTQEEKRLLLNAGAIAHKIENISEKEQTYNNYLKSKGVEYEFYFNSKLNMWRRK